MNNGTSLGQLRAILFDYKNAGLELVEVAMMEFAQKIINDANEIRQKDIDELRSMNLGDEEILDIVLTSTMRSFASKTFDAMGTRPDSIYKELESQLSDLLP